MSLQKLKCRLIMKRFGLARNRWLLYLEETGLPLPNISVIFLKKENLTKKWYVRISYLPLNTVLLQEKLRLIRSDYPAIETKIFNYSHDRFIIIDNAEVYHIGASLKDLGKKWFAFTRIQGFAIEIIRKLKEGGQ